MAIYQHLKPISFYIVKSLRIFCFFIFFIIAVFAFSLIIHECGHLVTAELLGKSINTLYIWPGIEIYPEFSTEITKDWPNRAVSILFTIPTPGENGAIDFADWRMTMPIIKIMGTASTLLTSILSLLVLSTFCPTGITRKVFLAGSFFYYDILLYLIFPHFFNLRHLIVIGGSDPEPITALNALSGLSTNDSTMLILSICFCIIIFQLFVLCKGFGSTPNTVHPS